MKRNTIASLGIMAVFLAAAVATIVLRDDDVSALQVRALSYSSDANGNATMAFVVTNGNSRLFPWFATVETPTGEAPYYVVETKTRDGWKRTSTLVNYSFEHYLLPTASWEFQATLDASDQPRRVILVYTLAHPRRPWVQRQARDLFKNLGFVTDIHELRSQILPANPIGPENESEPIRIGTNQAPAADAPIR